MHKIYAAYGTITRMNAHRLRLLLPITVLAAVAFVLVIGMTSFTSAQTTAPGNPAAGSSLEQRLRQRKTERAVRLDDQTRRRLETRCVDVQGKLRAMQNGIQALEDKRTNTYRSIDGKLWVTIGRLKIAGKDTFKLEKARSQYNDKTTKFLQTFRYYKQSVDDVIVMNCAADVVGFQAMLDTVRLYHGQLIAASSEINATVVDSIRPTITEYADQL